jgi:hypothetical protein
MSATRKHAHKRQDIFKKSYDEIIKSAKRKHSDEFYIFKTVIGNEDWFSECSVDAMGNSLEHWKKVNGKWQKVSQ